MKDVLSLAFECGLSEPRQVRAEEYLLGVQGQLGWHNMSGLCTLKSWALWHILYMCACPLRNRADCLTLGSAY